MKTETLYRPKNETAENILKSEFLFESVAVHVGEFYIKKYKTDCDKSGEDCAELVYEKVTHVLPDQIRDDAKKLELILKIGELIHDKIELQKKVELLKCRNKELEKELDSCKRIPMNEGRVIRESIEGQKETIESQKNEIARLESENEACFVTLRLERESTDRLKADLEEAKKESAHYKEVAQKVTN